MLSLQQLTSQADHHSHLEGVTSLSQELLTDDNDICNHLEYNKTQGTVWFNVANEYRPFIWAIILLGNSQFLPLYEKFCEFPHELPIFQPVC